MKIPRAGAARSFFRRFATDRRANFAVLTALSAPFAIGLAAIAIDQGALFNERRAAQSLVDIAAITAAANLDRAETAALTTLKDNGLTSASIGGKASPVSPGKPIVTVVPGRYTSSSSLAVKSRFVAGQTPFNAVQVSLRKTGTLYFGSSIMAPPVIGATAIAGTSAEAAFSVGSRLAEVKTENSPLLNALLGGLLGSKLSLSVMDYNALISADIDVLSFVDALAVKLNMTGVSYSEVLASKATVGQIATAMADIPGLDQKSMLLLRALGAGAKTTTKIPLNHFLDLGSVGRLGLGQQPAGLSVGASALSMLTAAGALANGSNQVALDLGATVPGLAVVTLQIAIGEPLQFSPWLAVGGEGTVVRTAQTRLKLLISLGVGNPNLSGGNKLVAVNLPLHVEVAHAEARLTEISCPTGRRDSRRVSIAALPGIASLRIGESAGNGFADFSRPLTFRDARIADIRLLILSLVAINGSASTAITNMQPTTLTFGDAEITGKVSKTASTRNLTQSLTTSLLDKLTLSVDLLGLGLPVPGLLASVTPTLTTILNEATKPIDDLLHSLLSALGVQVGQAEVRVTGATCSRPVLVQ